MHMSLAPERSSEHPAFLPASCTDSQTQQHPCGQELGCSVHFCLLSKPCELPDSLERSLQSHFHTSSASGHGRYEPLPMCAASTGEQGKARTRTSSPENSSGESPVRAASMGSGSCRLCTLVASQQRFLRCSALAKSHGSLLVCSDSCCRAAARRHNTRSSTASPRGMLCPAGLLLRHKHAQTTTTHASQSQRGCLPPSPGPRGRGAAR